jgi:polyphosphate kinase 2 (PPK2 family)
MSNDELSDQRCSLPDLNASAGAKPAPADLLTEAGEEAFASLQTKMLAIQQAYLTQKRRAIILFEGWDAAGKGGAIRRLVERLDQRHVRVWPIGPPSPVEQSIHYLYRFWRRLPEPGCIAVFDRSWYGRVLVERIDKLIPPGDWRRAYGEINNFEKMLTDDGVRLVKIFLHISTDEQSRRLHERLVTPYKRWKLSVDDFENLKKRKAYTKATNDMLDRTWTNSAPWRVIATDSKNQARRMVLHHVTECLSKDIDIGPLDLPDAVRKAAKAAFGKLPKGI